MNNKKINIYIDESGDTGVRFKEGSSEFFVISLLYVKNEDLFKIENYIKEIKNTLKIQQRELKFSHISFNKKVAFYSKIKNINFEADIFVYKKNSKSKQNFAYFIVNSLVYTKYNNLDIKITIDGMDKNKLNNNNLKIIKNIFKGVNAKILFMDSKRSILLQLSDMLAGLVHSIYRGKTDYEDLLKSIKHKIKITLIE